MRYLEKRFNVGVSNGKLSDRKYEIAVGVRCPKCKEKHEPFCASIEHERKRKAV